ncbi:MAG: nitroreductase family protein [Bacteroidota bacterium]|nr:nitroreductase family protein [Bacteroidota bacterium]
MQDKAPLLKETPTDHPITEIIENRWSPRVFSDTPVTATDLYSLFEAGRWAASCNNWQPWNIVYGIKGSEAYDRIFDCLDDFNQQWAQDAPALALAVMDTKNPDGNNNFHALYDLGQYVATMAIQAQSMGIAVHQMAGFDHEKAKSEFKFPEQYHFTTAIAIGHYGGDPSKLPDDLEEMEHGKRSRKPQEEFIFNGDYVKRADIQ